MISLPIGGSMVTLIAFVVVFVAASAALAWWVDERLQSRAPADLRRCMTHVAVALLVNSVGAPALGGWMIGAGAPDARLIAIMAIVLPALTYAFLAFLWVLRVARRQLPGALG
jgi:hypothetical protein